MSLSGNKVAAPPPKTKSTKKKAPMQATRKSGRASKPVAEMSNAGAKRRGRSRKSTVVEDDDEHKQAMEVDEEEEVDPITFPIVLTTYEMIIKDRTYLSHYDWGYIVVDEGHRLKNLDCKLMKEIKKYRSAGRMILTGTPLHVRCFFSFVPWAVVNPFLRRITWVNCGHFSISSCPISLTTSRLLKNGLCFFST